jgi:hydroxyacylglutathione hydrolase
MKSGDGEDMQITQSIHLIPRVRGANSYLFIGKEEAAVVDTGMPGNAPKILEFMRGLGKEPSWLSYILVTHSDIDHSGSVAELRKLTNARVAIHRADAPRLSGEMKLKEVKGAMGVLFSVMSPFIRFTPVRPDILLEDLSTIAGLTVIHTPGHTDGSISLYFPNEALFVGDALRTNEEGLLELPSASMTANMDQAKDSVKKVSELQFSCLLPGHGQPITSDASTRLREFVAKGFKHL